MNVTGSLDMSLWKAAMPIVMAATSKSLPEIANQMAMNVAVRAFKLTPQTDRARLNNELGVSFKIVLSKKTGGLKARRVSKPVPMVYAMVQARRARAGLAGLEGKELKKAAQRIAAAKLRSIGFGKSGYIPAIKGLNSKVKFKAPFGLMRGVLVRGVDKGAVTPAVQNGFDAVAVIANRVKEIPNFGTVALQQALDDEARDKMRHASEKLNYEFQKVR